MILRTEIARTSLSDLPAITEIRCDSKRTIFLGRNSCGDARAQRAVLRTCNVTTSLPLSDVAR
jgi:hypothetical protein